MLEYLIMNAPRVMDSLLALQIRAMKAELSSFQAQKNNENGMALEENEVIRTAVG